MSDIANSTITMIRAVLNTLTPQDLEKVLTGIHPIAGEHQNFDSLATFNISKWIDECHRPTHVVLDLMGKHITIDSALRYWGLSTVLNSMAIEDVLDEIEIEDALTYWGLSNVLGEISSMV